MKYVGVSGFVSRAEVDFALSVLPTGLTLMVGVLASPKSLSGIKNAWHRRYAAPADIADVFSPKEDRGTILPRMRKAGYAVSEDLCYGYEPVRGNAAALAFIAAPEANQ